MEFVSRPTNSSNRTSKSEIENLVGSEKGFYSLSKHRAGSLFSGNLSTKKNMEFLTVT